MSFLAGRRWAGVGLALLVELPVLAVLSLAAPSQVVGIPAAVAAAIAGTVAVVFGVADGVAVAALGALVFAAVGGWSAGELAAIGVWPAIVAAAGLFAQRVERRRAAFRHLVDAGEDERKALAFALHDGSAQTLTGALLRLRAAIPASGPEDAQTNEARELIVNTIRQLRRIARELSPAALEDFGLAAALEHLAESETASGSATVVCEHEWEGRLASEAELALFRFARAALTAALDRGVSPIAIRLAGEGGRVSLAVSGPGTPAAPPRLPAALEERIRLLDGRIAATVSHGELVLRADVPARARVAEPAGDAA